MGQSMVRERLFRPPVARKRQYSETSLPGLHFVPEYYTVDDPLIDDTSDGGSVSSSSPSPGASAAAAGSSEPKRRLSGSGSDEPAEAKDGPGPYRGPKRQQGGIPALFVTPQITDEHRQQQADSSVVLLYSHGNAENIMTGIATAQIIANASGCTVMCYDYRGYGLNHGTPSESACNANIASCFTYLVRDRRIDPSSIVLVGRSLGTGPTIRLAAELCSRGVNLGGMVVISGFESCVSIINRLLSYVPATDMFVNINYIDQVRCPTVIIHGQRDELISCSHAYSLWGKLDPAFQYALRIVDNGEHNGTETDPIALADIRSLVATVAASAAVSSAAARSAACSGPTGERSHRQATIIPSLLLGADITTSLPDFSASSSISV